MTKYIPPGFNRAMVERGLGMAMGFGEPTRTEDKATFFFRRRTTTSPADDAGVPFDPSVRPTGPTTKKQVSCAVEFYNGTQVVETFGDVRATRIKVTLLDKEWQEVADFVYVVVGGDKYVRGHKEPVVALGSLDVHTVWCDAEAES